MCAQRALRSAFLISLHYPPEDGLDPCLPTECSAKTLICAFAERTCNLVENAMPRLSFLRSQAWKITVTTELVKNTHVHAFVNKLSSDKNVALKKANAMFKIQNILHVHHENILI